MRMPLLKPIHNHTKELSFFGKLAVLLNFTRKWEVADDWVFFLPCGTPVVIPRSFIMDGASTPKFMWGLLDPVGLLLVEGIIHDFGYRYKYLWAIDKDGNLYKYHEGKGRDFWDKLFLDIGEHVHGFRITGYSSYLALRLFGRSAWDSNRFLNDTEIRPS